LSVGDLGPELASTDTPARATDATLQVLRPGAASPVGPCDGAGSSALPSRTNVVATSLSLVIIRLTMRASSAFKVDSNISGAQLTKAAGRLI
jgi:hypothetical protein